jgi:hypothetical protein
MTIGSGSPSTMSAHQSESPTVYSKAMKLSGRVAQAWISAARTEQAVGGAVRRDGDAVQVGVLGDPLQLGDAADIGWVGIDHVHRARLAP